MAADELDNALDDADSVETDYRLPRTDLLQFLRSRRTANRCDDGGTRCCCQRPFPDSRPSP